MVVGMKMKQGVLEPGDILVQIYFFKFSFGSTCTIINCDVYFKDRFLSLSTDLLIKTPLIWSPRILIFNKASGWLFYT